MIPHFKHYGHNEYQPKTVCRYYNSPRGCRYGSDCKFSHESSRPSKLTNFLNRNTNKHVQFITDNRQSLEKPSVDIESLQTLNAICYAPADSSALNAIVTIINANKSNVHFMNIICAKHGVPLQSRGCEFIEDILQTSIRNIVALDAKYPTQQKIWSEIAMFLCTPLNSYLFQNPNKNYNLYNRYTTGMNGCLPHSELVDSPLGILLESISNNYSENTVSYLIMILKQIMKLNPKLQIPLVYPYRGVESYGFMLKQFPTPNGLANIFNACSFGQILPFAGLPTLPLSKRNRCPHSVEDVHSCMPQHWVIIALRMFRDIYWNNVQTIIQDIIDSQRGNVLRKHSANRWNLDMMHLIVDCVGDNQPLIECETHKFYECTELNDIAAVVQCLKILNHNMNDRNSNAFYRADNEVITEWLNYFVKHRSYKRVPKTQNELIKCNLFANRAVAK